MGGEETPSLLASAPLGTFREVVSALSGYNTGADGSNKAECFGVLYGPGFTVQLPMVGSDDPVGQLLVSFQEEDVAWPVLTRICRGLGWKMMDPKTGRTFGV